jgi:hypothetical protein
MPMSKCGGASQWEDSRLMGFPREVVQPLLKADGDPDRLRIAVGRAVQEFGFERFFFNRRSRWRGGLGVRWCPWGDLPPGWYERHEEKKYARVEPIRRTTYSRGLPLVWDEATFPERGPVREYLADAGDFGIGSGVCLMLEAAHRAHVDFFSAFSPARRLGPARRREIVQRLPDIWTVAVCAYTLLPAQLLAVRPPRATRPLLLRRHTRR